MRILDENNVELESPDFSLGYLKPDQIFIEHHPAIEAVAEEGHYEVIAEYPNGGKDVEWVIDVEAVEAAEAWDEYEDIQRYIQYTVEELDEMERFRNMPTAEERIEALEMALLEMMGVTIND